MTPIDEVGWAMQAFLPIVVYLWQHMPKICTDNVRCSMSIYVQQVYVVEILSGAIEILP